MAIEWNRVTWYSKLLAICVFLATFVIAFALGSAWQKTADALIPSASSGATATGRTGAPCGGFIRNAPTCAAGFHCKLGPVADKGGVCVPN